MVLEMSTLPPVTPQKHTEVWSNLGSFPQISKYYGQWLKRVLNEKDPRTYPIIKQFLIKNYDYLKLLDQLLDENSAVKGFPTIIKHSKNKSEFYDEFSVLKFGMVLKKNGYAFEFIPPDRAPKPDIKAKIWNRDVFFEVKHLRNRDEANDWLFDYFNEYPSKFFVSITLDDAVTSAQIQECIQTIKTVIEAKKDEDFPQLLNLGFAQVDIELSKQRSKTPIVVGSGVIEVPFERTKFKIETTFHEALKQIKSTPSTSPSFVVYDIDDWKIESEDIAQALYGQTIGDATPNTLELQRTLYNLRKETDLKVHDKKILKAFERGFYDVLRGNLLIPHFSYNLQNGLFFLPESEDINGIIAFRGDQQTLFPNPFVRDDKFISYHDLIKMLTI